MKVPSVFTRKFRSAFEPGSRTRIRLLLLAAICTVGVGCIAPTRAAHLIVPSRCMKLNVQSFTRPCSQREDGKLVCDGVVITASCVEVAH
ncbi:MAG TPA: hypothetical protein VGF06_10525 [Terriglobales bacterium]|jgi:hypothetical protein